MRFLSIFYLAILIISGCTSYNNPSDSLIHKNSIDSVKAIEVGIDYLFKHQKFAPDFYVNPLTFIRSKSSTINPIFMVNGQLTRVIETRPVDSILYDWRKPKPYIEILKLKRTNEGPIELQIFFLTIGSNYILKIEENEKGYRVIPGKKIHIQHIRL